MKNLEKWRKKEIGYITLCAVLLVMPIIFLILLNTLFTGVLNQNNTSLIAIVCMIVFWGVALFVAKKHFYNMVVVDAMSKNEKRLRTDRRFYPSNRKTVSPEVLYADLSALGFSVSDEKPKLAKKGITGIWIVEDCQDYKNF